ncbi:hypothetical protein MRX96_032150 [Rhipicephalus microplus]
MSQFKRLKLVGNFEESSKANKVRQRLCDTRLVLPQCQYPTACYCDHLPRLGAAFRSLYHYDKPCDTRLVLPECQYPRACYCDQLQRLGPAFRPLYYYDKITNTCRSRTYPIEEAV